MEKTRTLYRLRKYKNGISLNLLTLTFGIVLLTVILLFEKSITADMRTKASELLTMGYHDSISKALETCHKAIEYMDIAAKTAILFSLEGFIIIFFNIRLSSQTKSLSKYSSVILGFGTILLFLYYLLLGLFMLSAKPLSELQSDYSFLRIIGIILIFTGNIVFIFQLFKEIILEKGEE
ncbi:MAG TPA: hypothetical protein PKN32_11985 [Bacteroidales bacterium]|nr:hypothetical protein [Bacteroidales bacterium]